MKNRLESLLWSTSERRTITAVSVLFLIACIVYLLVTHGLGIETEVIRDRYWKNAEPLFSGDFPVMEYPPLAIIFIAIPRLFGSTPWGYETAYVAMCYIFMVLGAILVARAARIANLDPKGAVILYAVLTLLMLEFVLDRFDFIAMIITLTSFVMLLEKKFPLAFALLAAGTLVKVYPAVLLPVFLLYVMHTSGKVDAAKGFVLFAITGIVIAGIFWMINPETITNFLHYNTGRPLQIESFVASMIYPFSALGLTDTWIQGSSAESFWSDNLRGPVPDAFADVMMYVLVACLAIVWILAAWRMKNGDELRILAFATVLCILMFLLTNKVFSSQYMIWLIGPLVFALALLDKKEGRIVFWTTVFALILTQVQFAYNVGYLGGGESIDLLGMTMILIRNLAVLILSAIFVYKIVPDGLAGRITKASD